MIKNIEFSKVIGLKDEVVYQKGQVVSKTIVKSNLANITLFSFDKDEALSSHSSSGDALVVVLDGKVEVTIGDQVFTLVEGQSILMPHSVNHALKAVEQFKMLLIISFQE